MFSRVVQLVLASDKTVFYFKNCKCDSEMTDCEKRRMSSLTRSALPLARGGILPSYELAQPLPLSVLVVYPGTKVRSVH